MFMPLGAPVFAAACLLQVWGPDVGHGGVLLLQLELLVFLVVDAELLYTVMAQHQSCSHSQH
jgi:hypothetical protein